MIESVTPSSIPAGVATTLTITGTGFGNHPTINMWGTNYSATAICNQPGKDVVTMSVNISASQTGLVPLYLISNGFGNDTFMIQALHKASSAVSRPGSSIGPVNSTLVTVNGDAVGTINLRVSSPAQGVPAWSINVPVVDQIIIG